jgi:DNA-binding response OmpR family regulator
MKEFSFSFHLVLICDINSTGMSEIPHNGSTWRVLLIDDDERILALARLAIAKNGCEVETASSATAGLSMLESYQPDLVVLDVVMPDLSGWETLRRIRESHDVLVMMLTGRNSDVDKARGLDLGADDYLTKPFSFVELEARVRALLRRARRVRSEE